MSLASFYDMQTGQDVSACIYDRSSPQAVLCRSIGSWNLGFNQHQGRLNDLIHAFRKRAQRCGRGKRPGLPRTDVVGG